MSLNIYRDMLSFCRPAGTAVERAFISRYISNLPGAYQDGGKNWHVVTDPDSRILWSCHTDTVHRHEGRQTIHVTDDGFVVLSKRSRMFSSCLGADDTTGCYLLREMILANVPGHYIFHYGEEKGGIGSTWIADTTPDFLRAFDFAIAIDRRGLSDVITHQFSGRTASDAFALSLATALGMEHQPSSHGIYTDTANYADVVPECTNISSGYYHEHTQNEYQDVFYLARLREKLCRFDASMLVVGRNPYELDPDDVWSTCSAWDRVWEWEEEEEETNDLYTDLYETADEKEERESEEDLRGVYLCESYAEAQRELLRQLGDAGLCKRKGRLYGT